MEGEEGGGIRLSKRFNDNKNGSEVDYKTKAGTAWSHSYLNQKPWHPLSYPNQRRKWIAEQTHAQRQRRAEEVSREVPFSLSQLNQYYLFIIVLISQLRFDSAAVCSRAGILPPDSPYLQEREGKGFFFPPLFLMIGFSRNWQSPTDTSKFCNGLAIFLLVIYIYLFI